MIRIAVLAGLLIGAIAFALGYFRPSAPPQTVAAIRPVRYNVPVVAPPGANVGRAADYFAKLNAPPPPPPPAKPPPPPPPPDVSVLFRSAVTAVLHGQEGPRLLVATNEGGLRKTTILKQGDVFKDGWRVAEFDNQHAVLRKGKDSRSVQFFGPSEPPPPPMQVRR